VNAPRVALKFAFGLLLALAAGNLSAIEYYVSDEAGMAFASIEGFRKGDFDYVLSVDRPSKGMEVRTLMHGKDEAKRWEYVLGGNGKTVSETVYDKGVISEKRLYLENGAVDVDESYEAGVISGTTRNSYANDRLVASVREAADGTESYHDVFRYTTVGTLREVERRYADGSTRLSRFDERDGRLVESWLGTTDDGTLTLYGQDGRTIRQEEWKGGAIIGREGFEYLEGKLVASTLEDTVTKRTTRRFFSSDESLKTEIVSSDSGEIERISYEYADSKLSEKNRVSGGKTESWSYRYGDDGKLSVEEYRLSGELEKTIYHTASNEYYEELYHNAKLFLRVYYRDSKKVKEEFILNGVTRTKTFE
jgi:antitoxin component YwqK of YwqJK toxin-antitoxin module